jgi:WD40 repeat protein
VYCVDMDAYAVRETMDGGGTVVRVDGVGKDDADFKGILSGTHVSTGQASVGTSGNRGGYLTELKGHAKAVLSLTLLDPSDLASSSSGSGTASLLASGSEAGTVRIWDLRTRSCVRVLRPWAPSSEGVSLQSVASSVTLPPVTGLVAVPRASSMGSSGTLAMGSMVGSHSGRRSGQSFDVASMFKPLKRFVRGSSISEDKASDDASIPSEDCCLLLRPRRDNSSCYEARSIHDSSSPIQHKKART